MKKKTKFKFKNNFLIPFIIAIIVCIIGAFANSFLFYKSFFRSMTKLNEEPIATISFKYKTAQRKFLDRVIWDRLQQDSPVYNGDTIHTEKLAEATIHFTDGNIIELSENTMVQVFLKEDHTLLATLSDGFASIDSTNASKGMELDSNGVKVSVNSGSHLNAGASEKSKDNNAITLQVMKGSAELKNQEGNTINIAEGNAFMFNDGVATETSFILRAPSRRSRILYTEHGDKKVEFSWAIANLPQNNDFSANIQIEISKDKTFDDILYKIYSQDLHKTEISLAPGNYYYKIQPSLDIIDRESKNILETKNLEEYNGRIQLLQSLPPEPVTPTENYSYTYRTQLPAVRVIWAESPHASSYLLEIADNPELKNPVIKQTCNSTSSIISTLSAGKYFWRVTPFYSLNKLGYTKGSDIQNFSILQKEDLIPPSTFLPTENSMVNLNDKISFSWKNDNEAYNYTLIISKNKDLSKPILERKIESNYIELNGKNLKLKEGKYFWGVMFQDQEGNASPISTPSPFYAMFGNPEQRTIEPTNGYCCAENLIFDTTFTWKKNLPENFVTTFEIATDKSFNNIIHAENVIQTNIRGINLNIGTYYWRLKSISALSETEFITTGKELNILGNLNSPILLEPKEKAVARESVPYTFDWEDVDEADYYKFWIFDNTNNELVYEDISYESKIEVNMFGKEYQHKNFYKWRVQAHSNAVPGMTSRRTGKITEDIFQLMKIRPIEILTPKANSKLDGIEAIVSPYYCEWFSVDTVKKAQFVLQKINPDNSRTRVITIPSNSEMTNGNMIAPNKILLDTPEGLKAGNYEIIVYAETEDGIDISNNQDKYIGKFKILPIPALDKVNNLNSIPEIMDIEYLKNKTNKKTFSLSWNKVKEATDYILIIKTSNGVELLNVMLQNNFYELDVINFSKNNELSFEDATFTWTIQAIRRVDLNKDGTLEKTLQESPVASSQFKTNIPTPKPTKTKGAINPYGQ